MRDLMDLQLRTSDGADIGRVDDLEGEVRGDGSLVLTTIRTGPEALSGRVSSRLRPIVERLLRGRFDARIPVEEVEDYGLTLVLRGRAGDYATGASERRLAGWIRRIPGAQR